MTPARCSIFPCVDVDAPRLEGRVCRAEFQFLPLRVRLGKLSAPSVPQSSTFIVRAHRLTADLPQRTVEREKDRAAGERSVFFFPFLLWTFCLEATANMGQRPQ